jgi:CDP-glycerol glycerophosphotransferase
MPAAVPRISVIVPIYNVERYLEQSLESAANQTFGDLEVIMVDDGSTDASAEIARGFAARDERFTLLTQANGGLSAARNTGLPHATGEYLAFLDSDDVLPPDAYERLLAALESSGSDFATGNVHRLSAWGTSQAKFLERTFAETRLGTHITRDRPLLADRTAWNKLFKRSFWDAHGFTFPEGRVHEDIPVILPLHFLARSVDVLSDPVYLYRIRDDGALSITQRRLEPKVLIDRLTAIEEVDRFLTEHKYDEPRHWYEESVFADDLRYHLNLLDQADPAYRALFLERVNGLLARARPGALDEVRDIDRWKWDLVQEGRIDELVERLRVQRRGTLRARLTRRVPVRYRRRIRRALRVIRSS